MVSLDDARTFLDVLEAGSLSAVARRRGVASTTLGRAIDRLEGTFGLVLMHRTSRQLRATPAGLAAAERLQGLVQEAEGVVRDVTALGSLHEGLVRASVCTAYARRRLAAPLARFACAHPRVSVELRLEDRWLDLAAEGVDLAVRTGSPPLASSSIATRLGEHSFVIVRAAHARGLRPRRPEDLAAMPLVVVRTEQRWVRWPLRRGDHEVVVQVRPSLEVNDVEMARALVVAGAGVAALPDYVVEDEVRSGALEPLLTAWRLPAVPVLAIHARRAQMTASARALLGALVRSAREDLSVVNDLPANHSRS